MKRIAFSMLVVFLLSASTQGQAITTVGDLVEACEQEEGMYRIQCGSWISGALDAYVGSQLFCEDIPRMCYPEGVTTGQTIKIFLKYIEGHPEVLHEEAPSLLVFFAMLEAFPCED